MNEVDGSAPEEQKRALALDLDAYEREGDVAEPFVFGHLGEEYMLADPEEVDWQDLLVAITSPHMFFRIVMSEEQRKKFMEAPLPNWKMKKLIGDYKKWYGLPSDPNAAGLSR